MSDVLALIPARAGSRGVERKNFRPLPDGSSCVTRAIACARDVGCDPIVVSTDRAEEPADQDTAKLLSVFPPYWTHLYAPAPLHTDTCAMIDVVRDALARVPGPSEQIILLLQPTQPLRTPAHLREAIRLLTEHERGCPAIADDESDYEHLYDAGHCACARPDSVVSVVALPLTHSPHMQLAINDGRLDPWLALADSPLYGWKDIPACRQTAWPGYIRDGTVYAFWRRTVEQHGNIYGRHVVPLIVPAEESCALDTMDQWNELERRILQKQAGNVG